MNATVSYLQELTADPDTTLSNLIVKTSAVATRFHLPKVVRWCNCELYGYPLGEAPEYRCVRGRAGIWFQYIGWLPVCSPAADPVEGSTICELRTQVGRLEQWFTQADSSEAFEVQFPSPSIDGLSGDDELRSLGIIPTIRVDFTRINAVLRSIRATIADVCCNLPA